MTEKNKFDEAEESAGGTKTAKERRALLKKLGRFAAVTAPTVTLLLAAQARPGIAQTRSCQPAQSSRAIKAAEGGIDGGAVLAGLAALPVDAWRYKPETGLEQQTHIGPYAEDFKTTFGVGNGVTISTVDAIGVCLAAIKGLSEKVEALESELRAIRRKKAF